MLTDYTNMTTERVAQVVDDAIATGETLIDAMLAQGGDRTYDNTLAPLDRAITGSNDAYGFGGFMAQVHPDKAVRKVAADAEQRHDKWLAGLAFRSDLYEVITAYSATDDGAALEGERRRNLDFWLRDFRRAGQELSQAERDQVEELKKRLIELTVTFESALSDWEDGIEMTREDLDGLPESFVERLDPGTTEGTYLVTVDYPDYVPFMNEGTNRELRRQLQFKFLNRGGKGNVALLNAAVKARWDMAGKLGYSSFADYAMEPKMADPKAVDDFYASIEPGLTELGLKELAVLQEMMEKDCPGEQIMPWDWLYYDTLQRKLDYGVDDNEISEYFPLEAAVAGMFDICGEMFGIDFAQVDDPKVWHPDVNVYAISDRASGKLLAHYYADLHPRPGKFSHAACWRLKAGVAQADGYRQPIAVVAANFTKATGDSPSLLKHDEVDTMFHEFGHVLHNALTEVQLPRFSGTQTERDFVEAPSQIMENWIWEPEVLQRFARHYQTDEAIPAELVTKMVAARDQNVGLKMLRQVFFGHYDLALHGGDAPSDANDAYFDLVDITLVPAHPDTHFGGGFGHMMGDGYVAGYYGYLWSKVYGDDMFSVFQDEGVLNPEVGMRYRAAILARGGTVDGIELLRGFLGREPSSDAFLSQIGLGK